MEDPQAHAAFGTIIAYGNGEIPSEEFTKIGRVKDIKGPDMKRDTIDVTNHDSPGGMKQFLASLADGGEVTFSVEFDPTDPSHDQDTGLMYLMGRKVTTNFEIIFPIESTNGFWGLTFPGLLTGMSPAMPVLGSLTSDVTIKVAGAVELVDDLKGIGYLS